MEVLIDPKTKAKFEDYPKEVLPKMLALRQLLIDTAEEINLAKLTETLKWGEPSFLTKHGSTLRMDWKKGTPNQYQLYCK